MLKEEIFFQNILCQIIKKIQHTTKQIINHNLLFFAGCGVGYFGTSEGCEICPKNTYNDEVSAKSCKRCQGGRWGTHTTGAVHSSQCVPCKEFTNIKTFVKSLCTFQCELFLMFVGSP